MSQKKLTRTPYDRKIAGVCGGLGEYFDIALLFMLSLRSCCYSFGEYFKKDKYIIEKEIIIEKKTNNSECYNESDTL